RLAFQTISNVEVYTLYEKYVNHDEKKKREIEKFKRSLWKQVESYLQLLPVNDRLKILTSLVAKSSSPMRLDEYRKVNH
ncbi:MAG: hypothetical protein ACREBA_09075, partial [Nitrosotalea sp.]